MSNPADPNEDRYQEIQRRIQARGGSGLSYLPGQVLDALNALHVIEELARHPLPLGPGGHGPFKGLNWAGVLLWRRNKGYHGYRRLTIFGIWSQIDGDAMSVVAGTKALMYNQPIYTAEAYHHLIRRDFRSYYDGTASPPAEALLRCPYAPDERLRLRDTLVQVASQWRASLIPGQNMPPLSSSS